MNDLATSDQDGEALPGVGHNLPPPDKPYDVAVLDALASKARAQANAAGEWRKAGKLETEEEAELCADHIASLRAVRKETDTARAAAKKVHTDRANVVQQDFMIFIDALDKSISATLALQNDFLQRKKARLEAEQAERARLAQIAADEVAARLAIARANDDAIGEAEAERAAKDAAKEVKQADKPVKASVGSASGGGRNISTRTRRVAVIKSLRLVYQFFEGAPEVRETLQRLANAHVRAAAFDGKDIPGTITDTEETAA